MDSKLWNWNNTSYYCGKNNIAAFNNKPDKIHGKNANAAAGAQGDSKAV